MPIVAVAGLIGGAGALIGGGLTVLETIAAVGSVVGGIGAITGNSTLTKIGAVAGLAGGIGAFAQNQGWLASADAASTASTAANESSAIDAMKSTSSGAEVAAPVDTDVASPASSSSTAPPTPVVGQQSPEVTKALGAGPAGAGQQPGGLMSAGPSAPPAFNAAQDSQAAYAAGVTGGGSAAPAAPGAGGKIMDLFNQMFRDKDGKLNKDMLSLAGNFVGGAFDKNKAAQTDLYEQRTATERQQLANGNAVPQLNFGTTQQAPVFKPTSPVYNPVRPAGLFNAR